MFYIAKRYFKGHSGETLPLWATESDFKAMTEDNKQELPTLEGKAALDLWRKGRDAWNLWITQHPGWDINFNRIDFSAERRSDGNLSFKGYHFGNNGLDFFETRFGNGNVDFSDADFGNSQVNFVKTTFGNGYVNFSKATFGDGSVNFVKASFGEGDVNFSESTFGKGNANFSQADFGDGSVNFSRTNFGGEVNFISTIFGNGEVNFEKATFGGGKIQFMETNFGDGNANFSEATFGDGNVNFFGATLSEGHLNLEKAIFGKGIVVFSHANLTMLLFRPNPFGPKAIEGEGLSIKRLAIFVFPDSSDKLESFGLQGASFGGPLFLSGNLGIVPDLLSTKSSHQVELSELKVKLRRSWQRFSWPPKLSRVTEDHEDSARLRRLKEIAEANRDHQAALRFSADENRARRWIETSWFGSVLDMAFSAFSDYGQNILRPFLALLAISVASMGLYKIIAAATFAAFWQGPGWGQSALLSISNSLPFLPQSRDFRADALKALYPDDPSLTVDALMITQGTLSFVFLFLIGLGLRNRFRL
ncbi:pentapeptide repeat-containing protein [Thalassospira lucentensis]|uniref:pentapeptide repeat-containing protein n=1 Tax=Thalassospira lucentensis TaxID=168935 RepID=UPI003AA885CF